MVVGGCQMIFPSIWRHKVSTLLSVAVKLDIEFVKSLNPQIKIRKNWIWDS